MADELDDRLRDLARDAEPLVVLAGPQAARARGERRRARRRTAAASVAAVLALTVGGWQLLPRLDSHDTGTATPAGTVTAVPHPRPTALQAQIEAALLPAGSLPYGVKWQWAAVTPQEAAKYKHPCPADPPVGPDAQATRTYAAQNIGAVADYRLLAYPDSATATEQTGVLRTMMQATCGIALPHLPPDKSSSASSGSSAGGTSGYSGASKSLPGVTAWVESRGRYVAVLLVSVPADLQTRFEGAGIDKCIAMSLYRLTPGATAAGTEGKAAGSGGIPAHFC